MRLFLTISISLAFAAGLAQSPTESSKAFRLTPHDAIWVHLYYLQPEHFRPELASQAFPETDSAVRISWAIQLKQVLDGLGLYVHMNLLPREIDYRDSLTGEHFYTPFPAELPQVYLERIDTQWVYSWATAQEIDALFKKTYPYGTHRLVDFFASRGDRRILGLSFWQLTGLGVHILLSTLFYYILGWCLQLLIRFFARSTALRRDEYQPSVRLLSRLLSLLGLVWIFKLFFPLLQFAAPTNSIVQALLSVVLTAVAAGALFQLVNMLGTYLAEMASRTTHRLDDQLVPVIVQLLKILVGTFAFFHVLSILHFNVTALIAGASIGGLALALAAQDTIKNFLGSVMIFADRPFQLGDWIRGSDFEGTVVQVGFRSTRIRTVDTSIISVPNGNMANVSIVNLGARRFRLFLAQLGVTYDTPPELLECFVRGIREIMHRNQEVSPEDQHVYFTAFESSSLNIFVRCHLLAPTFKDDLRIKECINMEILRWADHLGVRFAFPTSTIHIEDLPGQASLSPAYVTEQSNLEQRWLTYFGKAEDETGAPTLGTS